MDKQVLVSTSAAHYTCQFWRLSVLLQSSCGLEGSTDTTLVCLAPPLTQLNNYTVVMDAAPGPDTNNGDLQLRLVLDPTVTVIAESTRMIELGLNSAVVQILVSAKQEQWICYTQHHWVLAYFTLFSPQGERITNVEKEEITVWVGSDQCMVESTTATVISCIAPNRDEPTMENVIVSSCWLTHHVCKHYFSLPQVSIGLNMNFSVGWLIYQGAVVDLTSDIAAPVVVITSLVVVTAVVLVLWCYYTTITKYKRKLEIAQQPIYTWVNVMIVSLCDVSHDNLHLHTHKRLVPGQAVIRMTENIGYHSGGDGITSVPNAAYAKFEDYQLYEELPEGSHPVDEEKSGRRN